MHAEPSVVVQREFVKAKVPDAYLTSCGSRWRREGGPATTQDFVTRGDVAESGWACRDAQIARIRQWNDAP